MNGPLRKAALTALQIGVTLGILWLVFRDPAKRAEMLATVLQADATWLIVGLLAYGFVELLAGIRWNLLLRVQGIQLSRRRVLALTMIGVFFNFFIPGGTGGDMVKIFYLLKETPGQKAKAMLSVVVDRLLGLFALIVLAGVLVVANWHWLICPDATSRYVWATLIILAGGTVGIAFSFVVTGFGLVHRLPSNFPFRDRLAELALGYNLYGQAWRSTVVAILLSLMAHLAHFIVFYAAGRALASSAARIPSLSEMFAVMPIVNTITSVPISVGGVGLREKLFEELLNSLSSVSRAVAVVISSTGYVLTLVWGLLGGVIYMFYRPSEHARFRDIRREVQAFEHEVAEGEIEAGRKRK